MTETNWAIISPVLSAFVAILLGVLSWSFKRILAANDKKLDEFVFEIKTITAMYHDIKSEIKIYDLRLRDISASLDSIKADIKEVLKIEGRTSSIISQIAKIPEIEKDLDASHELIRSLSKTVESRHLDTSLAIKTLKSRSHFLANKLMVIKSIAMMKGWDEIDNSEWQMPDE